MAKARPTQAGLDHHAKIIAAGIARGRLPQPTPDLERFLLNNPT
jgi:hypothetical protein